MYPNYFQLCHLGHVTMLSRVVKEHQERQAAFREQQERKRKAAIAAVNRRVTRL